MTSSTAPPRPASAPRFAPLAYQRLIRVATLMPLWLFLILFVAGSFSTVSSPMFSESAAILGIPLRILIGASAVGWMLIGVGLAWGARSLSTVLLALVLFTAPATLCLILGPGIILILQNLG